MRAHRRFWFITASAVLAASTTFTLGRWQLSRAHQKEAMQQSMDARSAMPSIDGQTLASLADPTAVLHQGVNLRGHWLPQHTLGLDNRLMNGKVGLYVLSPMKLAGSDAVVLVQRGWVARNFLDRTRLPPVETPTGEVQIQGRVAPPPAKYYELGGADTGRIRQNLDLAAFRAETGLPLLAVSVQQTGVASEGLLREWPLASVGVDKHYGYAFQWFGLSGLITILYVWFQIVRRFFYPRRA